MHFDQPDISPDASFDTIIIMHMCIFFRVSNILVCSIIIIVSVEIIMANMVKHINVRRPAVETRTRCVVEAGQILSTVNEWHYRTQIAKKPLSTN